MKLRNQQGVATIIMIVVGVLVLAAVGYFVLARTGKAPAIPGIVGVALNDKCKYNDPDLCKFLNNFKTSSDYTVAGTTTAKGGSKSTFTFKVNGSDKFQNIMTADGKESYNMIVIGDTTYTKDYTDNKWFKSTATKDDKAVKDDVTFNDNVDSTPTPATPDPTYTKISTEACGKLSCFKYQVKTPGDDSTEFIWFDKTEYMLRQTQTTSADGSVTDMTYNYDKVTISAPSPTKDAAAAPAVPSNYTVPTEAELKAAVDAAAAAGMPVDNSSDSTNDSSN